MATWQESWQQASQQGKQERNNKRFKDLYNEMLKKMYPDYFGAFKLGQDWNDQAAEFTRRLIGIKGGNSGKFEATREQFEALKNIEVEIRDFLKRAKAESQAQAQAGPDFKNKNMWKGMEQVEIEEENETKFTNQDMWKGMEEVEQEEADEERYKNKDQWNGVSEEVIEDMKGPEFSNKDMWKGMDAEERERMDLDELRQEVDKKRKEWVEKEWKKRNAYKGIYNVLGRAWDKDKTNERVNQEDTEIDYYRGEYEKVLFDYKNLILQDAKDRGVSNQELGAILLQFETEKTLSIRDTRTQVKVENEMGKFSGMIKKHSLEIAEGYRKMSWKKKVGIAVAFGIAGTTLGAGAGAMAGITITAVGVRRAFMAAVTGMGAWGAMDARTSRKREEAVGKDTEEFMKSIEGLPDDEKFAALSAHLDGLITGVNGELQKIKKENIRNIGLGIGAGTLGFAASYVGHFFGGDGVETPKMGGMEDMKNWTAEQWDKYNGFTKGAGEMVTDNATEAGKEAVEHGQEVVGTAGVMKEAAKEKMTNIFEEVAKKGDNPNKIIAHFLEKRGMSHEEAGRKAFNIYNKFIAERGGKKPIDLIHDGMKFYFNNKGEILGMDSDEFAGYLPEDGLGHRIEPNLSRFGLRNIVEEVKEKIGQEFPTGRMDSTDIPDLNKFSDLKNSGEEIFDKMMGGVASSNVHQNIHEAAAELSGAGNEYVEGVKDLAAGQMTEESKKVLEYAGAAGVAGGMLYGAKKIEKKAKNKKAKKATEETKKKAGTAEEEKSEKMDDDKSKKETTNKKEWEKIPDTSFARANKILKFISLEKNENWKKIKGMTLGQIKKVEETGEKDAAKIRVKIAQIVRLYKEALGDKARPEKDETMYDWVVRISRDYSASK